MKPPPRTTATDAPGPQTSAEPANVARQLGATDLLILNHTHGRSHLLVGGVGVGATWAGSVAVEERDEPRLVAAVEGQIVRVRNDAPTRIIGPYFAPYAAVVSIDGVTVVLGGPDDWLADADDAVLFAACADAAASLDGTEPTRDLAHELGVYRRLQSLLDPIGDRDASARRLAGEAAELLAADYVVLLPEPGADLVIARPNWSPMDEEDLRETIDVVVGALPDEVLVIQDAADAPVPSPLSPDDGVVSMMIIPLTTQGLIVAVHTANGPRGFTSLDTAVGSLLAEIASVTLAAADTHTVLHRHVERIRWLLHTDPVTGLPDDRAWNDALDATPVGAVVSVGLGHDEVPDQVLELVGAVLQRQATDTDLVARLGPAEFGLLLRGADSQAAQGVADGVRERLGPICQADGEPIGIGHAASPSLASVHDAWRVAAGLMLQATPGGPPAGSATGVQSS